MREKFSVEREAPPHVHDLARQVEDAFGRVRQDEMQRTIDAQATVIADLQKRVAALETP